MDERLTLVETKLAYLEDMVMTLNDLVIKQQKELELLHITKDRLESRIAELSEMAPDIPQRRPPHY
jgi:SlyX protein